MNLHDLTNIFTLNDKLGDLVQSHFIIALALMFFGGILSSLSPSSVPRMVAIVNFTSKSAKDWRDAVILSSAFVLGIIVIYCGVGMMAGSFGSLLQLTGALYYITAWLCLLMGLSMIRLVEIPWRIPMPKAITGGFVGAFLLGLGFACLIAPDALPIMLGGLAVTTFEGHFLQGGLMMMFFGFGHGLPVLFVGSLAPWYMNNPKVLKWHLAAEMAAGYVLVVLALFFWKIA